MGCQSDANAEPIVNECELFGIIPFREVTIGQKTTKLRKLMGTGDKPKAA